MLAQGISMSTTKPVCKPGFMAKNIGNQTLLYSISEEVIHILNPIAQFIWKLCDGTHTPVDMEQAIRENFPVPAEYDVGQDIRRLLNIFTNKGLLR